MVMTSEYSHVWDCCCDHGFLGINLLARKAAPYIHFVDIVPELINPLTDQLNQLSHSLELNKAKRTILNRIMHKALGKHTA